MGFVGGSAVLAGVWLAVPGAASESLGPAHEPGLVWLGLDGGTPAVGIRTDTKQHQGSLFL